MAADFVSRREWIAGLAGAGWCARGWAQRPGAQEMEPARPPMPPPGFYDPLAGLKPTHPRLILTDAEMFRVQAMIREIPLARRLHEDLEREAVRLLTTAPAEYRLVGPRLLATSRRVLERVYTLALVWRIGKNQAYFDRAVRELRAAAAFPSWNPAHFLDVAEMTHAFAIGYDWLYAGLSEEERGWIRASIVEKGLEPAMAAYAEPNSWASSPFNWNLVSNGGIGIGALAVASEEGERARSILRHVFESVPRAVATYGPDGGWPEGPGYWDYATKYLACLSAAMDTALGTDRGIARSKAVERTGRFRIYSIGPTNKTFNFADASDEAGTAPEMFWLAREFDEPVYGWSEQREVERAGTGAARDPLDLVWFYKDIRPPQAEDWPLDAVFSGVQCAFFRTAWDDPNAIYLAVKGGDNKAGHAHLDLGSFVLDAGGVRWALDPGPDDYNLPGYFGKQRFNYFKTSTAGHNTLLVNDENQSALASARIVRREFGPGFSWVEIDLDKAYPKLTGWRRKIGLAGGEAVIIQDRVTAPQAVDVVWGMLTTASISTSGQSAELKKGDWVLSCEIRSPHHAVFDSVTEQGLTRLVARVGAKLTELELEIVMAPHRAGQVKPKVAAVFPA